MMQKINFAYSQLRDPELRANYDNFLANARSNAQHTSTSRESKNQSQKHSNVPDAKSDQSEEDFLKLFIGKKNCDYYLREFSSIRHHKKPSFNLWAGLFTAAWLLYRKMYANFFLYVLLSNFFGYIAAFFIAFFLSRYSGYSQNDISLIAFLCAMILSITLCGIYANRIYLHHAESIIRRASRHSDKRNQIIHRGGTSWTPVIVATLLPLVIGVSASLILPKYASMQQAWQAVANQDQGRGRTYEEVMNLPPVTHASSRDAWLARVKALRNAGDAGQLPIITTRPISDNDNTLGHWLTTDVDQVEREQTWWITDGIVWIHIKNHTRFNINLIAFDYKPAECEKPKEYAEYILPLEQAISPNSEALIQFLAGDAVKPTDGCLIITDILGKDKSLSTQKPIQQSTPPLQNHSRTIPHKSQLITEIDAAMAELDNWYPQWNEIYFSDHFEKWVGAQSQQIQNIFHYSAQAEDIAWLIQEYLKKTQPTFTHSKQQQQQQTNTSGAILTSPYEDEIQRQKQIVSAHQDFYSIIEEREFKLWIAEFPGREQKFKQGSANDVISLIGDYKSRR